MLVADPFAYLWGTKSSPEGAITHSINMEAMKVFGDGTNILKTQNTSIALKLKENQKISTLVLIKV